VRNAEQLQNDKRFALAQRLAKANKNHVLGRVSVAEIKRAIDQLTDDERLELTAFIRWRTQRDDPEWQAELARRIDHCGAGESKTATDVAIVHERLLREGK
jgi:hypothetical protein